MAGVHAAAARAAGRLARFSLVVGTLLVGHTACQVSAQPTPSMRAPGEDVVVVAIVVEITPGKPGAPTERVRVEKRHASTTVRAERVDDAGKVTQAQEAPIPASDFQSVWDIVEREDLKTFRPQETGGRVFDFGERRLRLEWQSNRDATPTVHEVVWIKPLANERKIARLITRLTELAQRHAPRVPLAYFR